MKRPPRGAVGRFSVSGSLKVISHRQCRENAKRVSALTIHGLPETPEPGALRAIVPGRGVAQAPQNDAGFTLIEALVALTVLALMSVSLMSASTDHTRRIASLEDRAIAGLVADARVAELRLDHTAALPGTVTAMGRTWQITAETRSTESPALLKIEVRVRPDGADGPVVRHTAFADAEAAQ